MPMKTVLLRAQILKHCDRLYLSPDRLKLILYAKFRVSRLKDLTDRQLNALLGSLAKA